MVAISNEVHWLLDRVVDSHVPVRLVLPDSIDQAAQWNVASPVWHDASMLNSLYQMEEQGLIEFLFCDENSKRAVRVEKPILSATELISHYHTRPLVYRMTVSGGQAWEAVAHPNWALKYTWDIHPFSYETAEECECQVRGGSEEVVRSAMLVLIGSRRLVPIPGTENYCSLSAWHATYWRELNAGIQGVVTCARIEMSGALFKDVVSDVTAKRYGLTAAKLAHWYTPGCDATWR